MVKSLMIHIEEEKLAKIWEVWLFGNVQGCLLFSRLERNFWRLLEMPRYSKHFEGIWKGGCLETSSIDPLGCYVQNFREGQPNQWIFSALGFTKDCCYMDWLHAVDHGAQVHDSVFFHSKFSRPFFGPCFFQDPNFSGHCFLFLPCCFFQDQRQDVPD